MNDYRRWLAGRLEYASHELARQAARVHAGDQYQALIVAARMAAVEEALAMFDAWAERRVAS